MVIALPILAATLCAFSFSVPAWSDQPKKGAKEGARLTAKIQDKEYAGPSDQKGTVVERTLSMQVMPQDASFTSVCDRTVGASSIKIQFECPAGQALGKGTWTDIFPDGPKSYPMEWGYEVLSDGKLNVKSYADWGDALHTQYHPAHKDTLAARLIVIPKGGPKSGMVYSFYAGANRKPGFIYLGPNMFSDAN